MLASRGALNFMLDGIKTGFANGVLFIFGNAAAPATANDALPGTRLGQVTVNGAAFTPGDPANGLNFDPPDQGIMQKPANVVWKFKGIASGIATYGVFFPNATDPGALDTDDAYPRLIAKVGSEKGTIILSSSEITVGGEYTVDDLTLDFGPQTLV